MLPEIDTKQFTAVITDSKEQVVAQSTVVNNQLQIEFTEKGSESYFVKVLPVSGKFLSNKENDTSPTIL